MFATLIGNISGFMYGKLLIVLLLAAGIWRSLASVAKPQSTL